MLRACLGNASFVHKERSRGLLAQLRGPYNSDCALWWVHIGLNQRTGVRHRDLIDLGGVQPNLALAAIQDGSRKPLLELERHHLGVKVVCYCCASANTANTMYSYCVYV